MADSCRADVSGLISGPNLAGNPRFFAGSQLTEWIGLFVWTIYSSIPEKLNKCMETVGTAKWLSLAKGLLGFVWQQTHVGCFPRLKYHLCYCHCEVAWSRCDCPDLCRFATPNLVTTTIEARFSCQVLQGSSGSQVVHGSWKSTI